MKYIIVIVFVAILIYQIIRANRKPDQKTIEQYQNESRLRFQQESQNKKAILSAEITVSRNNEFYVDFFSRFGNDVHIHEYIRMVLHHYGRCLLDFDPKDRDSMKAAEHLIQYVEKVSSALDVSRNNIFAICDIDDVSSMASEKPFKKISSVYTLHLCMPKGDKEKRVIFLELPQKSVCQQTVFSIIALIYEVMGLLNEDEVFLMLDSLSRMTGYYRSGFNYSELQTYMIVPDSCYYSALNRKR